MPAGFSTIPTTVVSRTIGTRCSSCAARHVVVCSRAPQPPPPCRARCSERARLGRRVEQGGTKIRFEVRSFSTMTDAPLCCSQGAASRLELGLPDLDLLAPAPERRASPPSRRGGSDQAEDRPRSGRGRDHGAVHVIRSRGRQRAVAHRHLMVADELHRHHRVGVPLRQRPAVGWRRFREMASSRAAGAISRAPSV